jgi:hypothetical protein
MTLDQARSASHPGQCDADVEALTAHPAIRRQLARISDADLIAELREVGAWSADELQDRTDNERRIVWIAAGNITEDHKERRP